MSHTPAIYDLTLFDKDGNPIWGTVSGGSITESSFQTPDPNKSHPRSDHLLLPTNHDGSEIDFLEGRTSIGAITASVVDFRQTATDQYTGLVTADIEDAVGGRAVLRRWNETDSAWRVIVDGVTHSYTMDQQKVVVYDFHIRDGQEFARNRSLFSSNFVLWGEDGQSGPGSNYLELNANEANTLSDEDGYLIAGVGPYQTESVTGLDHFEKVSAGSPSNGVHYGYALAYSSSSGRSLRLPDLGYPTQSEDGLYRYNDFRIEWRAAGTNDPYTVLSAMPRAKAKNAVLDGSAIMEEQGEGGDEDIAGPPRAMLYFGSTTESDLPNDGQAIEYRVYAEKITEDTPFVWDNGTLGDLWYEILQGTHSDSTPEEQVDSTELTNFRNNTPDARFILTEPVEDGRRWISENIFLPALAAIGYDTSGNLVPTYWERPDTGETVDVIDEGDILEIGEWKHGISNAIGRIEFTYLRESLAASEQGDALAQLNTRLPPGAIDNDMYRDVRAEAVRKLKNKIPALTLWERLKQTEVTVTTEASDAVPGAETLKIAPVTIRSTQLLTGSELTDHPGSVDELGNERFTTASKAIFQRFRKGAATYRAEVHATDTIIDYTPGTWLRVRAEWLPDYETSERGLAEYMQIIRVSEIDPSRRELLLVSGNVPDPEADSTKVSGTDCFTGGTLYKGPDGRSARYFSSDGNLQNTCADPIDVDVLLVAGGGSGGDKGTGGGAGQALIATSVTINAGETIPVTIGSGGSGDAVDGGNTTLWVSGGTALDPNSDPEPSATTAQGGGKGHTGAGHTPQEDTDHAPGGSFTQTGACCNGASYGGGGASNTGDGSDGSANLDCSGMVDICETFGGDGAASTNYPTYGVTVGAGGDGWGSETTASSGAAPGGGGGANASGSAGKDGAIVVLYAGTRQTLSAPTLTSQGTTSENQVQVCVSASDWPDVTPAGYRVRVDWAWGTSEPAEDSGDWRLAGYIEEAGGCVTTGQAPSGQTIYTRSVAEADEELPSEKGTTVNETLSSRAELVRLQMELNTSDQPVLTWAENDTTQSLRLRGKAHDADDSTDRDLPQIKDVDDDSGTDTLTSITVAEGRFFTLDVECYDDVDWGYNRSVLADSPTAYLRLGEGSGTTANDASGNGNDGTYTGSPTLGATGLLSEDDNTAVSFDGNNDAVTVSGVGSLGSDVTKSVGFWVSTTESGNGLFLCGVVNNGDDTKWMLATNRDVDGSSNAGRTTLQTSGGANGNAYNIAIDDNIYDGDAHYIAIVQSALKDIKIYVDGAEATIVNTLDQGPASPTNWDQDIAFGARNNAGTLDRFAAATIDEAALYPTALTAAQVLEQYEIGTAANEAELQVAGNEGETYRVSVEHFENALASSEDLDQSLDNLTFDAELGLALDYQLNPVRDSS